MGVDRGVQNQMANIGPLAWVCISLQSEASLKIAF